MVSSPSLTPAPTAGVPEVLVIVSGSMAAVKAPSVLRRLREGGAGVQVIATRAALQFITPLSLSTAADTAVATDETWFEDRPDAQHLRLAGADAVVVVGASADLLARAATGQAGDLASATLLSVRGPVLWVPAMNERMWQHPAVQANVQRLRGWGHQFLGPEYGRFGTRGEGQGVGRMSEPEEIAAAALALLAPQNVVQDMAGLKVVVSAGPTREYLDPVRFISNPSSGKMGFAVAEDARTRGAEVTLVTGPGTAPTWHPSCWASVATRRAPDRAPASTTTVAAEMAPSSRERARNRCRGGTDPGGSSLTSAPTSPARSNKSRWPLG